MSLSRAQRLPIMCLTQDNLSWSHVEQVERLCRGGARWIQLRMKLGAPEGWASAAETAVKICRQHRATCVINDHVDVALAVDADGVHLGKEDLDWREARERLGPGKILGGTVNNDADATRAVESQALDYVGVGPWRFTANKKKPRPGPWCWRRGKAHRSPRCFAGVGDWWSRSFRFDRGPRHRRGGRGGVVGPIPRGRSRKTCGGFHRRLAERSARRAN